MITTLPSGLSPDDLERVEELLADRAVFGLDPAEEAELAQLAPGISAAALTEADQLATLATLAGVAVDESLPVALRQRLVDGASAFADLPRGAGRSAAQVSPAARFPIAVPLTALLALAAGLLLGFFLDLQVDGMPPVEIRRASLVANAPDLVQVAWVPQKDASLEPSTAAAGAEAPYGDVVWSDSEQAGYLRFRGLKANDPDVEQYQLWVFDEARSAERPVDGGVFNIRPADLVDGEAIIPIDAKLPITKATLFAITVEQPGGVVVSDRSRLPLLASR